MNMTDKQFQKLLDSTVKSGQLHQEKLNQCHKEILIRYGVDYNASDCDFIIDSLDYSRDFISVQEIDDDIKLSQSHGSASAD